MALRLGINIDHVATLRNARGGAHPDIVRAAQAAQRAGADGITIHLREDRRHIRDADVFALREHCALPINLEMAATTEMQDIALRIKPNACCIVPEKRAELTTEGGLNVVSQQSKLAAFAEPLRAAGIRVSLFVDPVAEQIKAAKACHADTVELHTGAYCDAQGSERAALLQSLRDAAFLTQQLGLECHAGHGLNYENVGAIAAIPAITELNIGHFLVGEAVFIGLEAAIKQMRQCIDEARGA